ncbi:mucin-2-like isoform X3 [Bolinopsis microptera]|uniref:mucin-2-like isoform X3 n=1 Tax=Bolinopsis microptera TaxID=2820187 RepID=UPI00307ABF68
MASDKHFLYHLIISQLYHDGFGPHASLLEQAALNTNRAVGPSDRLKQMLSLCAHTVREVDNYFDDKFSTQPFQEDVVKSTSYVPAERMVRSNTPSHFHTFARRRLTAAKRHSFMSMNRAKQLKSSPKTLFSNTCPKTSHVPIIYSSASESPVVHDTQNSLQGLFNSANQGSGGMFVNDVEKAKSAEAVRVLQNIFQQKRDMLPTVTSVETVQSEISQDLNTLINATTSALSQSSTSPTTSQHSLTGSPKQNSPHTPDHMDLTTSPVSGSNRSAFSPPTRTSNANSVVESMVTDTEPPEMMEKSGNVPSEDQRLSPDVVSSTASQFLQEPVVEKHPTSPEVLNLKEEAEDADCIDGVDAGKIYPPASQDIIDQLNSLSASGIGNIQNLANSLTSSFCDTTLSEGNLASLSTLSMESLASSLNLSVANVTGLDGQNVPTSRAGGGYTGSGNKLDFLSRLEGDSPSMLSMMSSQNRASSSSTTPPTPDWSGWSPGNGTCTSGNGLPTSGEEKFYQCPYCPKIYTTTQSLHRHKHSHTGTNMKACPLCGKTSYRVDNLKSHIRNCYKKRLRLENMPEFTGENACTLTEST